MTKLNRRQMLALGASAAFGLAAPGLLTLGSRRARAQTNPDQKLLIVLAAFGGASILDSFLPVAASQVTPEIADTHYIYPDELVYQPGGSNLRVVRLNSNGDFMSRLLDRHYEDMAVVTQTCSSVNHFVAQKRAITGAGINQGRTIMEAASQRHGSGLILPNTNMATGGFIELGDDETVDPTARAEVVADARFFGISAHGTKGQPNLPEASLITRARGVREQLEDLSHFGITFQRNKMRQRYLKKRREILPEMESADLITRLMLFTSGEGIPLEDYGLSTTPEYEDLVTRFPNMIGDPLQAQAAVTYLLLKYGLTTSVTFGPNIGIEGGNLPLAFDFSHNQHITAQNAMWNRISFVLDGLIDLLKITDWPGGGGTLWDRSLIYVATDFGRDKTRPAGAADAGTGHHLNNGHLVISPLVRGNQVYGDMDPATCLTFGFDGATGQADPEKAMNEGDSYSLVAQALDIDFPGRRDMSALVRG